MLKEIFDTPQTLQSVVKLNTTHKLKPLVTAINKARTVYTLGSGTAGVAASQIAYYLRSLAGINAISLTPAEAESCLELITSKDLVIAPSQSGETADVIEILEQLKSKSCSIATYVNMEGTTMTSLADYAYMAGAGPEICVMSTKIFSSQIAWGYLVAEAVAGNLKKACNNLTKASELIDTYLHSQALTKIKQIARNFQTQTSLYILATGELINLAEEGMIKLIEGSYVHAHSIPAANLKHFAITLMEPGVEVIVLVGEGEKQKSMQSAIHEIKARGARVTAISAKNNQLFNDYLPSVGGVVPESLGMVIPLQLLAYYLSLTLGHNVDRPRNIAKSVTVK